MLVCWRAWGGTLVVFAAAACGVLHTRDASQAVSNAPYLAAQTPAWGSCQATSGAGFGLQHGAKLGAGRGDGCGIALDGNAAEVSLTKKWAKSPARQGHGPLGPGGLNGHVITEARLRR